MSGVSAADDRLGPINLGSNILAPDQATTGVVTYTVQESDLPGPLTNTVTVTGTPPTGTDVTGAADETVDVTAAPPPAPSEYPLYFPLILKQPVETGHGAPDLVVTGLTATSHSVQVVVGNQGTAPVSDAFWVDVYIDPHPAPTAVNQVWHQLGSQGLVWGVDGPNLPLASGATITLTVGDATYWPGLSRMTWPLAAGIPVYAQVDSVNTDTSYGGVLEDHEITGGKYNNIAAGVSVAGMAAAGGDTPHTGEQGRLDSSHGLPPR